MRSCVSENRQKQKQKQTESPSKSAKKTTHEKLGQRRIQTETNVTKGTTDPRIEFILPK